MRKKQGDISFNLGNKIKGDGEEVVMVSFYLLSHNSCFSPCSKVMYYTRMHLNVYLKRKNYLTNFSFLSEKLIKSNFLKSRTFFFSRLRFPVSFV